MNSYANEWEDHPNHWETTQSFDSALELSWVRSLGREDPLEKEMATHSNTVAWRIPWREELKEGRKKQWEKRAEESPS